MRRIDHSASNPIPRESIKADAKPAADVRSKSPNAGEVGSSNRRVQVPVKPEATPSGEANEAHAALGKGLQSLGRTRIAAGEALPSSNLIVMRTKGHPFSGIATGYLKRSVNRRGESEALFIPDERTMKPFALSPYDAQGIASGGRVTIVGGVHGLALDIKATESVKSMVGRVEKDGAGYALAGIDRSAPMQRIPLDGGSDSLVGKTVLAHIAEPFSGNRRALVRETFSAEDVWESRFLDLATRNGVEATFSDNYLTELTALKKKFNPDAIQGYVDMTDKPFITIDNPYSKDFDQAMYIEDSPDTAGAHDVYYAIADTSYFMSLLPPGSEIAERAKRMQTTTYMPGIDAPIFHRDLSEDLISLIPNAKRPALVCKYTVGSDGKVLGEPTFIDGVIMSRVASNYPAAQAYIDGESPGTPPMLAKAFDQLKATGGALLQQATARKMLQSS
ncbi:MAG: RNB domain-containing ribonuclease, partial [Clostridia bacterium]|nr:RNB domain-containing ribonuclease [Deltaproteobacteria bacterium]